MPSKMTETKWEITKLKDPLSEPNATGFVYMQVNSSD